MRLETLSAIAQLIAALGVIASLFYLAAQIRQNTRSMRAVVVDSLAHSLIDLLGPQAHDVEFTRAFSRLSKIGIARAKKIGPELSLSSSPSLNFSRVHGSKSAKGRSIRSNGKDGTLTRECIFICRE